ncbi:MAG: DUF309 domain-containing protein [Gemmatimonadota bacterium]
MTDFPAAFDRFVDLFERGEYWASHEALEAPWRRNGSRFYHGLILFASAFVHVERGNPHGIDAQLRKAERALEPFRPTYHGLDVEALLDHARRCRRIVAERRDEEGDDVDWSDLVPRFRLVPDPELVRGDEPELTEGA